MTARSTTRPVGRLVVGALAIVSVAGASLLSLLREVDTASRVPAMLTSFAGYAVIGFVGYLGCAAWLVRQVGVRVRSWVVGGIAVAIVGLLLQLSWNAPLFVGGGSQRADLTVMTLNLQFGTTDAAAVVRTARTHHVDVLVLEEVTFEELPRLRTAGLRRLLPHQVGLPAVSAAGTMVFSRYPLTDAHRLGISNGGVAARVGAPRPFQLLAVHPGQPRNDPAGWHRDLELVRGLARAAVRRGPTLVVGDLNATRDHRVFRSVLGVGLRDAAEQSGAGWQPTWPESLPKSGPGSASRGTWLRPVIAIDHVLASRQFTASRTYTFAMPGSDHRALVAQLSTRGLSG